MLGMHGMRANQGMLGNLQLWTEIMMQMKK